MLHNISHKQNLEQQLHFLHQCRKFKLSPKGLSTQFPRNLTKSSYSESFVQKTNTKLLLMAISDVNRRLNCVKNNICALRLILEGYNLGQKWMNNIEIWLRKIAEKENWMARKRLQKKLKILKQNKK